MSAAASGAKEQVARLLTLVPYLNARGGVRLDEAASDLGVPARQLVKDLRVLFLCGLAQAHGIAGDDQEFLLRATGPHIGPYIYLGAKHMVTGYDHLLFLVGVIFFLYRTTEVVKYVSLFTLGHSVTLLLGVWANIPANAYLIDAIIGLSVVYKGFENIGGFEQVFGHGRLQGAAEDCVGAGTRAQRRIGHCSRLSRHGAGRERRAGRAPGDRVIRQGRRRRGWPGRRP